MNDQSGSQFTSNNPRRYSSNAAPRAKTVRIFGVFTIRDILLGLSLVGLGIFILGATFLIYQVFWASKGDDSVNIMDSIHIIMPLLFFIYMISCITAIVSVRSLNNLSFPWIIEIISWLLLAGLVTFYMYALARLWMERYAESTLIKFAIVLGGGFFVLIGMQFGTFNRSLVRFAIPLLLMNLTHLFALVFRYEFLFEHVNKNLYKYDIGFFAGMVFISVFMMRGRTFQRIQNILDRLFEESANNS